MSEQPLSNVGFLVTLGVLVTVLVTVNLVYYLG